MADGTCRGPLMRYGSHEWGTRHLARDSRLGSELAQVVVDMLVHQDRPLFRSEPSKEGVRMGGAGRRTFCDEAIDRRTQAGPFNFKISLILDDQAVYGGGVSAHWLVVFQGQGLDDGAEDAADQLARGAKSS